MIVVSTPVERRIAWMLAVCWPAKVSTGTESVVSSMFVSDVAAFCVCTAADDSVVIREISTVMP